MGLWQMVLSLNLMNNPLNYIKSIFKATSLLLMMLLFSCSTQEEECNSKKNTNVSNPNGDSELALAMRKVFDQTEEIKESLKKGDLVIPPNYIENLKKFHTATPTDPEVKISEFYGFVNAIDKIASELDHAKSLDEQKKQYSRIIETCILCHQSFCPGPIRRINKLKIGLPIKN